MTLRPALLTTTLFAALAAPAIAEVASSADQIASSILAAPEERRDEATVLGYKADGSLTTLRRRKRLPS